MSRPPLAPATLHAIPSDALLAFLAGRRWFGAKGAAPRRAAVHDVVPVREGTGDGDAGFAVARVEVELGDGRVERYQLPLASVEGTAADVPVITAAGSGALIDATQDPAFRALLARGLEHGARYDGEGARWVLRPLEGADVAGLGALPVRLGSAEQSNSSLLLDDRAILKLYRKLEAGEHPDVEIARFLTTRTDFRNTPALLGTITFEDHQGAVTVAGMLQALVPGARDAWAVALDAARAYLRARDDAPPQAFAAEMRELGRVTRALHDALASDREDPAFAPRAATAGDVAEWAARVRDMARDGTALLTRARTAGRLRRADEPVADAVLRRTPELLGDLDTLAAAIGAHPGERIRHHGDYHLGQVLKGADGRYMIIDFEGEPARLLAERRTPSSALRDVAGMLRSFAYAAASAAMERGGVGTDPEVERRSARWERAMREAFLDGYQERGAAAFLPRDPQAMLHLVMLFEMEKVFYELAYELNNRPDWAWIPLRGIGRLLGSPSLPRRGA
jgi:maltose alpha-D-glucosyltransferase/alpha-amylase